MENKRNERKVREGIVVSNKMDKTVVVIEETMKLHKLYKKRVKTSKKYKAHDENNDCGIGDKVQIMETRPLSKNKRWRRAIARIFGLGKSSKNKPGPLLEHSRSLYDNLTAELKEANMIDFDDDE